MVAQRAVCARSGFILKDAYFGEECPCLGPPGLKFTMFLKNNSENGDLCFSARGMVKNKSDHALKIPQTPKTKVNFWRHVDG